MEYAVGCRMVHKDLIYEILSVVEEIPEGCVATYGQIARLIGRDKNSRLVGKVLSMAEYYGQSCGASCTRMAGTASFTGSGTGRHEGRQACGLEKMPMGLLKRRGR